MVRGVNRYIIELQEPDSRYFDRVLLFVKPKYGNEASYKLKAEGMKLAKNSSVGFQNTLQSRPPKTKARERVKSVFLILFGGIAALGIAAVFGVL